MYVAYVAGVGVVFVGYAGHATNDQYQNKAIADWTKWRCDDMKMEMVMQMHKAVVEVEVEVEVADEVRWLLLLRVCEYADAQRFVAALAASQQHTYTHAYMQAYSNAYLYV